MAMTKQTPRIASSFWRKSRGAAAGGDVDG